uniref:Uncharacterized protein n=1 Tax=Rhizophora mucronata TaxID=61149 RepID=A0A2P2QB00_RHIMU
MLSKPAWEGFFSSILWPSVFFCVNPIFFVFNFLFGNSLKF